MSDESPFQGTTADLTASDTAELPHTQPAEQPSVAAGQVPIPEPETRTSAWRSMPARVWGPALAVTVVVLLLSSGVSFGAGVFVGRHVAIANGRVAGAPVGIGMRGGQEMPLRDWQGQDGPGRPGGRRGGMRGGPGPWSSPDGTATVPQP